MLGKAHKRSRNFKYSEGIQSPVKDTSPGKIPLNKPLKGNQKYLVEKRSKKCLRSEQ